MIKSILVSKSLLIHPLTSAFAETPANQNNPVINNQWNVDKDYFTVTSAEKKEVEVTDEDQSRLQTLSSQSFNLSRRALLTDLPLKEMSVDLDIILNMGKKIWKIVEDGKPVVNVTSSRADAIPQGAKSWVQLANWSDPEVHKYEISYKNVYGMAVVKYAFLVTYSYGGNIKGKGKYLSEVGFTTSDLSVAWMYNFNASSEVVRVVNVGTPDDPVAGMEINLNWTVKTPLQEQQGTSPFYIRGDGSFKAL